ncbi:MAG: 2-dehydropantoate 2-reductase [Actinomycetota bacterium]
MARVAVVGPGSVGVFFAAHLALTDHEVIACARRRFDRYRIDSATHAVDHPATVAIDPGEVEGPVDWVLFAVKAHQTEGAAAWLEHLCGPDTRVVVVQNGVEHERVLPYIGEATMIPTVVYCGAELLEPGHAQHHASAHLIVPEGPDANDLVALFADALPEIRPTDDFATPLWTKLSLNVMANGLTALTRRDMTVIREPEIGRVAVRLLREAWAIGRAEGASLDDAMAEKIIAGAAAREDPGGTSMYYDTMAGRPTEHDAIHGAALRFAAKHGIDAPAIETTHALLEHREAVAPAD